MAQYYMFICPNCGTKIAATKGEAEQKLYANSRVMLYKYTCLKCQMPMLIKSTAMTEIDAPMPAEKDGPRAAQDEPDEPDGEKRLNRIALTIDHFRAYQHYERRHAAMSRAFDITRDDAEVIILGLEVLKDLQELDSSLDAAVNFRIREKRFSEIIQKMKEGLKA